jgi:hypothetical protein
MTTDGLLLHHRMPFESIRYGIFIPDPERCDPEYRTSNEWLADQVGFWPTFSAVGDGLDAYWIAGYDFNWRRRIAWSPKTGTVLRKAGEYPNEVLFSFQDLDGVFMDLGYWVVFVVSAGLNDRDIDKEMGLVQRRWLFKPAWSRRKWLRYALGPDNYGVLLLCSQLDLREAGRVWVRNRKTKHALERMGFTNVDVHRIPVLR